MVRTTSPQACHASKALGAQVAAARKSRRWTVTRLAEQAGVSVPTLRKVERGDPSVALGTAFDVAILVGVPLFTQNRSELAMLADNLVDRAALLGNRVTPITDEGLDDDF